MDVFEVARMNANVVARLNFILVRCSDQTASKCNRILIYYA